MESGRCADEEDEEQEVQRSVLVRCSCVWSFTQLRRSSYKDKRNDVIRQLLKQVREPEASLHPNGVHDLDFGHVLAIDRLRKYPAVSAKSAPSESPGAKRGHVDNLPDPPFFKFLR